jgi:hypothetical protein
MGMTVSKVPYFSWSGSGIDSTRPPFNSCSPNLVSIQDYCRRRWGVRSLGCHVPPPASTHSHPYGAANDILFDGGRGPTLEAIDFLIANSAELGVNTIHDYFDHQRMWKPIIGWTYNAPIGSPGGQWIHVETTPAAFGDGRPVEDKLTGSETDVALTGDDAQLVAVVVWERPLTRNGVTKPAREWLTGAHDYAVQARDLAQKAADNSADGTGTSSTQWAHWATDWATEAVRLLELIAPPPPPS